MALKNTTASDPDTAAKALEAWLATKLPEATEIAVSNVNTPSAGGMSAETVLFDAAWTVDGRREQHGLVARITPDGPGVFPEFDIPKEFAVIEALGKAEGVAVPKAWWLEEDESILGGRFLVVERIDGRIPADDPPFTAAGWVTELTPEQRYELAANSIRAMAAIHGADWRAIGLEHLDPQSHPTRIEQQIAHWRRYFDWARAGDENPTVEAGFAWLEANRPAEEGPAVLNWGDARPGNQIFGEDLAVRATLDWEMVDIGTAEMDLAWWLLILRHHTEGIGVPVPEGLPSRDEVVRIYEEATGTTVRDLDYYEVFGAVRLAAIMHRAGRVMIEVGFLPPDAPMKLNNPASQILARLIGREAPSGDAQTFIGNRG